jgi:hypothetical protein
MGWVQVTNRKRQPDDVWIACDRCGGAGSDYSRENLPTEQGWIGTDSPSMAFRGYYPTNLCDQCGGEGGTWLPKSKDKNRLNVAYDTAEDRDSKRNWRCGLLQTWKSDEQRWHPPVSESGAAGSRAVWCYDSDTDPEQWEGK